jgi:uracil phosphoribosyltransferase
MAVDIQYQNLPRPEGEIQHRYGENVHILSQPYPMSLLARLCSEPCIQPEVNTLVRQLFAWMFGEVASRELPTVKTQTVTRMGATHPEGVYDGEHIDAAQAAVVVDIARAGILPGGVFYDALNVLLDPTLVRQDHVFMNRVTDENGQVTGVDLSGSKIGGPVDEAVVFIPDPMAATGASTAEVIRLYKEEVPGDPRQIVVVHLIVTPEYVQRITSQFPDVQIYAIRMDRGLSAPQVLEQVPGADWTAEKGLNNHQYIVPGGGGFGEVINNAWV